MQNGSTPFYRLINPGVILAVVLMVAGSFAGGVVLTSYFSDTTDATVVSQAEVASQPDGRPAAEADVLAAFEQALVDIYQIALPTVVKIRVKQKVAQQSSEQLGPGFPVLPFAFSPDIPQPAQEPAQRSEGSGFVWDKAGHIVTNYHVIVNATEVRVRFADGRSAEAEVLGTDPNADLAVLKVNLPPNKLRPLPPGNSDTLQPGQLAFTIGAPSGQEFTLSSGIISAVDRTIDRGLGPYAIPEVIQTDALIKPGNSGGPLLNRTGAIVGIYTQIINGNRDDAGVGYAIPINIARHIVSTLIRGERFEYPWLGITGMNVPPEIIEIMNLPGDTKGVFVIDIAQDSPASKVDLQGSDERFRVAGQELRLAGDIIVAIDGQPFQGMGGLMSYLIEETHPGDKVTLDIVQPGGKRQNISVTLGVRPQPDMVNRQNK